MLRKIIVVALSLTMCACFHSAAPPDASFKASTAIDSRSADAVTEAMLTAMGGRERWAGLASLRIRAVHHEDRLDGPYDSEIWRNIGRPEVRIRQLRGELHSERLILPGAAYSIRNGECRAMSAAMESALRHWDAHVFYTTIARIARGEPELGLSLDAAGRLLVTLDDRLHARLSLSEEHLPVLYAVPQANGEGFGVTHYTRWKWSHGYRHPEISEVPGLGAVYHSQAWVPSATRLALEPPAGCLPDPA